MTIKKTKLYYFLRKKYYAYLKIKHYQHAKRMPENEYEEYLIKRYVEFANKREYSRGKNYH